MSVCESLRAVGRPVLKQRKLAEKRTRAVPKNRDTIERIEPDAQPHDRRSADRRARQVGRNQEKPDNA